MNRFVAVCTEETPLVDVYNIMLEAQNDYICVVENRAHQKPIGIITEHDICIQILARGRNPRSLTAANVMNTNIIKADHGLNISECARLIGESGAKRVLAVDDDGNLCGSVSIANLNSAAMPEYQNNYTNNTLFTDYQPALADRIF